jgi:hypothetical protein
MADEKEIAKLVDKRVAEVLGLKPEELKQYEDNPEFGALTCLPSVLSIVRTTAVAHC